MGKKKAIRGNSGGGGGTPTTLEFMLIKRLWIFGWEVKHLHIRADQIHHVQHILYIPETVCFVDDQLDLIVGGLYAGIAHPKPCCVEYMFSVTLDLLVQFPESLYLNMACPPHPADFTF